MNNLQKIDQNLKKLDKSKKILTNLLKFRLFNKKARQLSETQYTQKICEKIHNLRPTKNYRCPRILFRRSLSNVSFASFLFSHSSIVLVPFLYSIPRSPKTLLFDCSVYFSGFRNSMLSYMMKYVVFCCSMLIKLECWLVVLVLLLSRVWLKFVLELRLVGSWNFQTH